MVSRAGKNTNETFPKVSVHTSQHVMSQTEWWNNVCYRGQIFRVLRLSHNGKFDFISRNRRDWTL